MGEFQAQSLDRVTFEAGGSFFSALCADRRVDVTRVDVRATQRA